MTDCVYEENRHFIPPKDPQSNGLPEGGTSGQVLVKTDDGYSWATLDGSGTPMSIDSALSTTSTNPVQNRAIGQAVTDINASLADVNASLSSLEDAVAQKTDGTIRFKLTYTSTDSETNEGVIWYDGAALEGATYQDLYDAVMSGANVIVEMDRIDGVRIELRYVGRPTDITGIEDSVFVFASSYTWRSGDFTEMNQATFDYYSIDVSSTIVANDASLVGHIRVAIETMERVPLNEVIAWFPFDIDEETEFGLWGWTDERTSDNRILLHPSAERGGPGASAGMVSSYTSDYGGNKKPRIFLDAIEIVPEDLPANLSGMGATSFKYYTFHGTWDGARYSFSMGTVKISPAGDYWIGFNSMRRED